MTATAPTLETGRLVLRGQVMDDFPAYAAFFASDRAGFMGGPIDERAAWKNFCADVAQWALLGHGAFAITDKATGDLLGQVSIGNPPSFPEREIGWLVYEGAEGHGIAREAAECVRGWVYKTVSPEPLVSYIAVENTASIRLAERLGARLDPDAAPPPFPGPHHVYRHPVPEALQ